MRQLIRLASVVTACALPLVAHAQSGSVTTANWGVIAGFSSSSITDINKALSSLPADLITLKRRFALDGGFFVNVPFAKMLSAQTELRYAQRGASFIAKSPLNSSIDAEATYKIDYIDVPIMLRLDIGAPEKMIRPTIMGGVHGAYRLRCSFQYATTDNRTASDDCDETDGSDTFKSTDAGMLGGAGVTFNVRHRIVTFQVRYSKSFSSAVREGAGVSTAPAKNTAVTFLASYVF